MKTKEELNALKIEFETLNAKLAELTDEELKEVTGGIDAPQKGDDEKNRFSAFEIQDNPKQYEIHVY